LREELLKELGIDSFNNAKTELDRLKLEKEAMLKSFSKRYEKFVCKYPSLGE
jgi:hypothetical protein